jgi:hypothetical protein
MTAVILDPTSQEPIGRQRTPRGSWFALLPQLRDLAVVLATATYALGHGVWAIYSFTYGLGAHIAGQMQYFIAGAPALAAVSGFILSIYWLSVGFKKFQSLIVRRRGHKMRHLIPLLFLCSMAILNWKPETNMFTLALALFAVPLMPLQPLVAGMGSTVTVRILTVLPLIPIFIFAVYLYATSVYPQLPLEFGGGRPQCVMVGVRPESITPLWRNLVLESRSASLYELKRASNSNASKRKASLGKLIAIRQSELNDLIGGKAKLDQFAEAGPLLLWAEGDSDLLLSVHGFGSKTADHYTVRRIDSMVVRYVSSLSLESEGCPPGSL